MRQLRRSRKRTVSGHKRGSAAVLFFVGLTLLFLFLQEKFSAENEVSYESSYVIIKESRAGKEEIPLEEYLVGALAVSVPEDYEPEACKAQAVILRTNVEYAAKETESGRVAYETLGQISLTKEEMYERWGGDYEAQYEKLKTAVEETQGETFCYNGIAVELPFFPLSAGATRDSKDLSENKKYPYLQSVPCGEDVFAPDYRQEVTVSEKELGHMLQRVFGTEEKIPCEEIVFTKDSAGYVTEAAWNGKTVSGETIREELALPSACFTIEKNKNDLLIVTKGSGHGLGMSLYAAGKMAAAGKDYREILQYFFPDCEIAKN